MSTITSTEQTVLRLLRQNDLGRTELMRELADQGIVEHLDMIKLVRTGLVQMVPVRKLVGPEHSYGYPPEYRITDEGAKAIE